eukprot:6178671-Pleurochrysis_carterae.AAC.1
MHGPAGPPSLGMPTVEAAARSAHRTNAPRWKLAARGLPCIPACLRSKRNERASAASGLVQRRAGRLASGGRRNGRPRALGCPGQQAARHTARCIRCNHECMKGSTHFVIRRNG